MTLQELKARIQKKDPTDAPTNAEMLALIEIVERRLPDQHKKLHEEVHGKIMAQLPKHAFEGGQIAMAQCGICEQVFEWRGLN